MKLSLRGLLRDKIKDKSIARRNILKFIKNFLELVFYTLLLWPLWRFITFKILKSEKVIFPPMDKGEKVIFKNKVYLVFKNDKITALSAKCTHLGCTVNYCAEKKLFRCPCHGSVFNLQGKRICGPASRPLTKFHFTIAKNGSIIVRKAS